MVEKYTEILVKILSVANEESRERILLQWEKEIFSHNTNVRAYLKSVYSNVKNSELGDSLLKEEWY